jgi:hypothetical protein
MHPTPPVLTGPPALTVLIGGQPAWKGIPLAAGPGLLAASTSTQATLQTLETTALAAEAAAAAAAGTPGAPAAVAAATAARLAAETAKASSAAANAASIAAAAAGGSIHACAMPWPIPPHGPGVVIDGSPTVMIENSPACRLGDTIIEAIGPPNKITMGCPTVIIGDSGGGGGAGGAAGTAGAGAAGSSGGAMSFGPGPLTPEQAQALFSLMAAQPDIAFRYPRDGCYARAQLMVQRMQALGITPGKAWTFASSRSDPLWVNTPNVPEGHVAWGYHVAPTVPVRGADGIVRNMVVDPSMFDHPVTVDEWRGAQHDTPRVVQTAPGEAPTSNGGSGYWPGPDPPEGPDTNAKETMEDFKRKEGT